jgi:hypothetical protein
MSAAFWRGFRGGIEKMGAFIVVTPFNWSALKSEWARIDDWIFRR